MKTLKKTMNENYKIVSKFIKDISGETPDIETYLFVRDQIKQYQLGIDINSKALKNKMIEVSTKISFRDKSTNEKKSIFEINYASVVKIDEGVNDKKELGKILLCDVQKEVYPELETIFVNLINKSGYPNIKFEKKVDFEKLYSDKLN